MRGYKELQPFNVTNFAPGDYVYATKYSDADLNDPYCVGFIDWIVWSKECCRAHVRVGNENIPYQYRYGVKITGEEGNNLLKELKNNI
jgi:hypothetical protein